MRSAACIERHACVRRRQSLTFEQRGNRAMEKSIRRVRTMSIFAATLAICAGAACRSPEGDEPSQTTDELGATARDYTLFEADPVRPVAVLEASGWVAVANTPDDVLEIFRPLRNTVRSCARLKVG